MIKTVTVAIIVATVYSAMMLYEVGKRKKAAGKPQTKHIKCKQRGKYLIIVIFIHVLIDFVCNTCWIAVMFLYMLYLYKYIHMFSKGNSIYSLMRYPWLYNPPMTIIKWFSHSQSPCVSYSVRLLMARITSCMWKHFIWRGAYKIEISKTIPFYHNAMSKN